ncbi:phage tail protein, partial [Neisseria gonorrhoeae]
MANATEQNQFDQAVRLIESGDSVVGPGAPVNQPLQALANRTLLLKNQTEAL